MGYLKVGINFVNKARAYDLSLIVDVKTKEDDLEKYAKDGYH